MKNGGRERRVPSQTERKEEKNGSTWSPTGEKEGSCVAARININCYAPPRPPHTHIQPHTNRTKHLVTAKFTRVTSTVSLTSNSPVCSGSSCYKHLITVLCWVPLVLLPSDLASFTRTDSQHGVQSNIAPAAGQEMPAVRACPSGNMRFRTSLYKNYAVLDVTDREITKV